ncbi:MAG TPA: YdcF family protein [Candidatus Nanoarchaeia archaeon]|nr:YdcF family protein [Candidatus Nanoarchaeia archaeon]
MVSDVIIVLGGGVTKEGTPTGSSLARIKKTVELFQECAASYVLMSGAYSNKISYTPMKTEAQAMKDYAMQLGIPEEKIILEEFSMETVGNAYFSREIVKEKSWKSLLIVTSDFHVERTAYIFQKTFGTKYSCKVVPVSHAYSEELDVRKEKEARALHWLKQHMDIFPDGDENGVRQILENVFDCYGTLK